MKISPFLEWQVFDFAKDYHDCLAPNRDTN
jgi:hypothetical protein